MQSMYVCVSVFVCACEYVCVFMCVRNHKCMRVCVYVCRCVRMKQYYLQMHRPFEKRNAFPIAPNLNIAVYTLRIFKSIVIRVPSLAEPLPLLRTC